MMVLSLLLGTACSAQTATDGPTPPAETAPSGTTEAAAVTETMAAPTVTPDVSRVLLVSGPDVDPVLIESIRVVLESLTAESGLRLIVLETVTAEEITPGVQLVVGLGEGADLSALAAGAPATQFLAVGDPAVVPGGNLSRIGNSALDQRRLAFMAGYLAALASDDYKIAALTAAGTDEGVLTAESFVIGARFYCGLCQPKYPPYGVFPKWEGVAVGSGEAGWRPVVDALVTQGVEILFIQAPIASLELFSYLSDLGVKMIGESPEVVPPEQGIGTLALDPGPPLRALWPDLMAGTGGLQQPFSVQLLDRNPQWVSEGRYRLFEAMLMDLEAGLVSPEPAP